MKNRTEAPLALKSKGLALVLLAGFSLYGGVFSHADFHHPKLDPHKSISGAHKVDLTLLEIATRTDGTKGSLLAAFDNRSVSTTENGLVLDIVAPNFPSHLPKLIGNLGAEVVHVSERHGRLAVVVPDSQVLFALAGLEEIRSIHLAHKPIQRTGSVNGLAAEALQVPPSVTGSFGVDGSGILVGIISDSFAVTNGVRGPGTTIEPAETTTLTYTIPDDGEYTFVIQAAEDTSVSLQWSSSDFLFPLENSAGLSAPCRTRLSLHGVSGSRTVQTIDFATRQDLQEFVGGSCAPGSATHTVLFGFVAEEGTEVTFTTRAAVSVFLSARSDCETRLNEECASPSPGVGVPILRNALNQITGDLPPTVFILEEGPESGIDEGAAMAELVYDIAPGAAIAFHTAGLSPAAMADGIRKLAELGKTPAYDNVVLVDDIGWGNEPVYQPGAVNAAVDDVSLDGISFFSAAGNDGDGAIRQVFRPASGSAPNQATPPNGADLHIWPNGNAFLPVTIDGGRRFTAFLHWNQPDARYAENPQVDAAEIDLDIYLTRTPNLAGLSEATSFAAIQEGRVGRDIQGRPGFPIGSPFEFIDFVNSSSEPKTLYLAVNMFAGTKGSIPQISGVPVEFTIIMPQPNLDSVGIFIPGVNDLTSFDIRGSAVWGHPTSPNALAVASVLYLDTPAFDTTLGPTNFIDPQPYSSRGGRVEFFFDRNSRPVTSPMVVNKPDVSAVDGNSTTFFVGPDIDLDGFNNFLGTSAAAPNAAAVAALLLNLNRDLTPGQISTAMKSTAIDVIGRRAAPGYDHVSGHGLIDGLGALIYVEEIYGRTTGAPSPRRISFDEGLEASAWEFNGISDFDLPIPSQTANSLSFTTVASSSSYGWWNTPEIVASPVSLTSGERTILGSPGPDTMVRVTANLHSNMNNPLQTAGTRMRVLSSKFERSSEMVLTSTGSGSLMPVAGDPRQFRHYLQLPATDSRFRVFLDLFGFDPTVPAGSMVTFRNLEVLAFDKFSSRSDVRFERLIFFQNNSRGWTPRHAAGIFPPVASSVTANGLELGPPTDPSAFNFAYWGSPENQPIVVMEKGRVYEARFRISSNLPSGSQRNVPLFRVRINDETLQLSSLAAINARHSTTIVPVGGESIDYFLYWEVPEALDGRSVYFSFDMIYETEDDKDPNARLTLEALRVESFRPPELIGEK